MMFPLQKERNKLLENVSTSRSKAKRTFKNLNPIIKIMKKKIRIVLDKKVYY